jgi:Protein of unknown function (DUF559)
MGERRDDRQQLNGLVDKGAFAAFADRESLPVAIIGEDVILVRVTWVVPPQRSGGGGPCEAWWRGMRAPNKAFSRARKLRREMTLPEIVLWQALGKGRLAGLRFRRQNPIGPYILDFYCPSARLAVEVDVRT